jgi:subtilisin family serine protease
MKLFARAAILTTAVAAVTVIGQAGVAAPDPTSPTTQTAKAQAFRDKTGPLRALSSPLARLYERGQVRALQRQAAPRESRAASTMNRLMRVSGGYVTVDVIAAGDPEALRATLESEGMIGIETFGKVISGRLPVAALADAASTSGVLAVRPTAAIANVGSTTSQGDVAMRADEARQVLKVAGRKVRVGVLSDSFNCLAGPVYPTSPFKTAQDDRKSKDLMKDIIVLADFVQPTGAPDAGSCAPTATDEGRAMMQIIADVAPRADGAFHTAFTGTAGFANGILRLASKAKSDIIVDDVIYFDEPMFQDGVIAQAVDQVVGRGVAYFSSAGNEARQAWQGAFRASRSPSGAIEHRFGPGPGGTRQTMRLSDGALELLSFQWNEPYISAGPAGSRSDLDLYFYDSDGNLLPDCDTPDGNGVYPDLCQYAGASDNIGDPNGPGGEPVELAVVENYTGKSVDVQIGIELYAGRPPSLMKYVYYDLDAGSVENLQYATNSPAGYGHSNARGAEAVGAAAWYRTAQWGNPLGDADKCTPACLEYFSSAGGTPIYFDDDGRRLPRPEVRVKPGVTGPDRGDTTFFYADFTFDIIVDGRKIERDGFPNFAGTSASAPHVAAVAALMLEASEDWLSPQQVIGTLRSTAQDMTYRRVAEGVYDRLGRGFDNDSGFGFVDAYRAVCTTAKFDERRTTCNRSH